MAPGSPTRAFDPSPALDYNRNHYSPFNRPSEMLFSDSHPSNSSRGVRFADPNPSTLHRAHSIATENVPLLPQVSSASQIPKQAFRMTKPGPGIDIDAYIENCRNLNEQLRSAHDTERRAWNIERTSLKSRIADLEFQLNKSKDTKRRSSIESSGSHSARADVRAMYSMSQLKAAEPNGVKGAPGAISEPEIVPVWRGPEHGTPTTRVFIHEDINGNHLPSISEDESFPFLTRETSPTSQAVESIPIHISQIEPTLDGITIRSSALHSSFETKITSPQFHSPTDTPATKSTISNDMHIDPSSLLPPLDEKLRRNAGHTPMNFSGAEPSFEPSNQSTAQPSPEVLQAEKPPAPVATARPPLRPAEGADSYFSNASDYSAGDQKETFPAIDNASDEQFEVEDDRPLRGPLMLDPSAKSKAAESFLSSVDAKLMQAVKEVSPTRKDSIFSQSGESVMVPATALQGIVELSPPPPPRRAEKEADDDMPRLRLKKSSNFGSAYGMSIPGRF